MLNLCGLDYKLKNIIDINKGKKKRKEFINIGLFVTKNYLNYKFIKHVFNDSDELFFSLFDPFIIR